MQIRDTNPNSPRSEISTVLSPQRIQQPAVGIQERCPDVDNSEPDAGRSPGSRSPRCGSRQLSEIQGFESERGTSLGLEPFCRAAQVWEIRLDG